MDQGRKISGISGPGQPVLIYNSNNSKKLCDIVVNLSDSFSPVKIANTEKRQQPNIDKHGKVSKSKKFYDDEDFRCGIGCFNPDWVQTLATKKIALLVFTVLGVIQRMAGSYFIATISTLEKRFQISSHTMGIIMSGCEVSKIIFALILSHYGANGHRPRWIATGVLFSAISCFLLASPHLFYGSGNNALSLTREYSSPVYTKQSIASPFHDQFMDQNYQKDSFFGKNSGMSLCTRTRKEKADTCSLQEESIVPLALMFISQFLAGIGIILLVTLGGPYLDDNSKKRSLPMLFGITMSSKQIGPFLGFLFAYGILKLFVDPFLTPLISSEDPRWIGAWWLGWMICGNILLITAVLISMFPRSLKRHDDSLNCNPKSIKTVPKITEIPAAVKVLLKNKVNVLVNLSMVSNMFTNIGLGTYMPKYMEAIFMQTPSNASAISGTIGILQATSFFIAGFLISKFRFSARSLTAWSALTAFISVMVQISFTQMGCDVGKLSFGTEAPDGTWNLTSTCNNDCNCKPAKILPVCYKEENTVFYSACHAGCTVYENNTIGNCSCLPNRNATVTLGNCAEGCANILMIFVIINAVTKFIDATGRVGNMLISYRCVKPHEKSLSIGLGLLLQSTLAFLPAPIIFGWIIDNVCIVWGGSECGTRGSCMFYDGHQLRYIYNLTAAGFTLICGLLNCLLFYYVKDLDLYSESKSQVQLPAKVKVQTDKNGNAL